MGRRGGFRNCCRAFLVLNSLHHPPPSRSPSTAPSQPSHPLNQAHYRQEMGRICKCLNLSPFIEPIPILDPNSGIGVLNTTSSYTRLQSSNTTNTMLFPLVPSASLFILFLLLSLGLMGLDCRAQSLPDHREHMTPSDTGSTHPSPPPVVCKKLCVTAADCVAEESGSGTSTAPPSCVNGCCEW